MNFNQLRGAPELTTRLKAVAVEDDRLRRVRGKSTDELLAALMDYEIGSPAHEQAKAAIQVRVAEEQREAARDNLRWAKIVGVSTSRYTL
jgi:hypothetical protein